MQNEERGSKTKVERRTTNLTPHASRFTLIALLAIATIAAPRASAQGSIVIEDRGVTIEFPERLTFAAHVESSAAIDRVVLEYGVEKLTCGEVTAKAFPNFEPGASIDVSWTWEMRQSGSLPPGARIWYRWRAGDIAGKERVSDEQRVTWLDDRHNWQSISRAMLTFHWYDSPRTFAEDLLNSAVDSLAELSQTTGVAPQSPIDMYIYAGTADLRDAILYEPGWTGGLAYPDHDILLIGISPNQIEWGKDTQAHELTHVLVGHLTFSCLGSVPTWLNEGIAVYGEGGPDRGSAAALDRAIADDRLISVRALNGSFSEHPDQAGLSYEQSYSLVNFLVTEYGSDRLLALLRNLRDGMTIEEALSAAYGFGLDGLEDGWRASIGAKPRRAEESPPTLAALPTPVPTYRPISGVPFATSLAATREPAPGRALAAETPVDAQTASTSTEAAQSGVLVMIGLIAVTLALGAIRLAARSKKSS